MGLTDFIPGFLKGESEAQSGGLGNLVTGLPDLVGEAAGTAALLSPLGDINDAAVGITGEMGGRKLSGIERGLSLLAPTLGITAGVGILGYAGYRRYKNALGLEDVNEVLRSLRSDDRGVLDFQPGRGKPVAWQATSDAPEVLQHHPMGKVVQPPVLQTPEQRLMSVRSITSKSLASESFEELAGALRPADDDLARARTAGFVEEYGNRLVAEVHPEQSDALLAANWEMTKLVNAVDAGIFDKGGQLAWVPKALEGLRSGKATTETRQRLLDFAVQFAGETRWINDPELAVHPLVRISSVDDTGEGLRWQLDAELFEDIGPWESIEKAEQIRRAGSINHAALMDRGVANITEVLNRAAVDYDGAYFTEGMEWYERAHALAYGHVDGDDLVVPVYRTKASAEPGGDFDVRTTEDFKQATGHSAPPEQAGFRRYKLKDFWVPDTSPEDIASVLAWKKANPDVTGEQFAGVIAAISAGMGWNENIVVARKVLDAVRSNRWPTKAAWDADKARGLGMVSYTDFQKAARIAKGESFEEVWFPPGKDFRTSAKTTSFATNIIDPAAWWAVVMDRHANSIFHGVDLGDAALEPFKFTERSSGPMGKNPLARAVYLSVSDAYRAVAESYVGPNGEKLLPQQIQAITWSYWRKAKGDFYGTKGGMRPGGMRPFELDPETSSMALLEGRSQFDATLLETVGQQSPGLVAADALRGQGRKVTGSQRVTLEVDPDGQVTMFARDPEVQGRFTTREQLRHMHPVVGLGESAGDQRLWLPNAPVRVSSIDALGDEILSTTVRRQGGGTSSAGWREYGPDMNPGEMPSQVPGHHMVINALDEDLPAVAMHERFVKMLKKSGIKTTRQDLPPHNGVSTAWETEGGLTWEPDDATRQNKPVRVDEPRQGSRLTFDTPEDLARAWEMLDDPYVDPQGRTFWRDLEDSSKRLDHKPGPDARPWTWAQEIYGEQILDRYAVTGSGATPKGTKRAWEHLFTDAQKRTIGVLSAKADSFRGNTSPVWVDEEFFGYFKDSKVPRLEGGAVNRLAEDEFSDGVLGGVLRIAPHEKTVKLKADGLPKSGTRAAIWAEDGPAIPTLAVGADAVDRLAEMYNANPAQVATVRFGSDYVDVEVPSFEIEIGTRDKLPIMREMVDMRLFDRVKATLDHLGESRTIRPKIREIES